MNYSKILNLVFTSHTPMFIETSDFEILRQNGKTRLTTTSSRISERKMRPARLEHAKSCIYPSALHTDAHESFSPPPLEAHLCLSPSAATRYFLIFPKLEHIRVANFQDLSSFYTFIYRRRIRKM